LIHVCLHVAITSQRPVRDTRSNRLNFRTEIVMSHNAIHQSEPVSFRCVDDVRKKEQLLCLWSSSVLSEQPGCPEVAAKGKGAVLSFGHHRRSGSSQARIGES